MECQEDGSYVLSGGVGALGLVTTKMMAEEGAKSVVLLSRRGVVGDDLKAMWEKLQDLSCCMRRPGQNAAAASGYEGEGGIVPEPKLTDSEQPCCKQYGRLLLCSQILTWAGLRHRAAGQAVRRGQPV